MTDRYDEGFNIGFLVGVLIGISLILIVQSLCSAMNGFETMAPVNIKSTNRHWRFESPYAFGFAGPAGSLAGSLDRSIINVSQLQREEDIAQGRKYKNLQAARR